MPVSSKFKVSPTAMKIGIPGTIKSRGQEREIVSFALHRTVPGRQASCGMAHGPAIRSHLSPARQAPGGFAARRNRYGASSFLRLAGRRAIPPGNATQ